MYAQYHLSVFSSSVVPFCDRTAGGDTGGEVLALGAWRVRTQMQTPHRMSERASTLTSFPVPFPYIVGRVESLRATGLHRRESTF